MRKNFIERKGKLRDLDRSFDLKFWQAQPAKARFEATWELVIHYMKVKEREWFAAALKKLYRNHIWLEELIEVYRE